MQTVLMLKLSQDWKEQFCFTVLCVASHSTCREVHRIVYDKNSVGIMFLEGKIKSSGYISGAYPCKGSGLL